MYNFKYYNAIFEDSELAARAYMIVLFAQMIDTHHENTKYMDSDVLCIRDVGLALMPSKEPDNGKVEQIITAAKASSQIIADKIRNGGYTAQTFTLLEAEFTLLNRIVYSSVFIDLDNVISYVTKEHKEFIEWCKKNAPDAIKDLPVIEQVKYMKPIYERMTQKKV